MPASVFPASAVRRPAPPLPAQKPVASHETVNAARQTVRAMLQHSQAFNSLPEDKRRQLAHDLVQIGSYLAEPDGVRLKQQSPQVRALAGDTSAQPQKFGQAVRAGVENMVSLVQGVNFPGFVSGLIQGVFHSIVDSSIQQMEAYAKLVADVSKSLNQFRDDNTTENQGRVDGRLDLAALETAPDTEVIASITAVKGLGVWSAEMFLMFRLNRPDVFPVGDLGIVKGVQQHFGMKRRPKPRTMIRLAENWRPYRTIAAWYLWRLWD